MADSVDGSTGAAGRWELSREALDALLQALDSDRNAAAGRYELLRRKLIDFYTWRGGETPEELADEALNRLARRLLQGEPVEKIERYALGIARLLLKEAARRREQRSIALRDIRTLQPGIAEESEMSDAFERCLEALPEASRKLIARYYSGDRVTLAGELGLSLTALRTRALRIRKKLYECVIGRHKRDATNNRF
jgi:DNA-directed RNA polymerase specialized sigma24 family protein